jgi:hypothetical protein
MTRTAVRRSVVGGVDTHADTIHVGVLDSVGRELGDREFCTTPAGHAAALAFVAGFGAVIAVGIEALTFGELGAINSTAVNLLMTHRLDSRHGTSGAVIAGRRRSPDPCSSTPRPLIGMSVDRVSLRLARASTGPVGCVSMAQVRLPRFDGQGRWLDQATFAGAFFPVAVSNSLGVR